MSFDALQNSIKLLIVILWKIYFNKTIKKGGEKKTKINK